MAQSATSVSKRDHQASSTIETEELSDMPDGEDQPHMWDQLSNSNVVG